MSESFVISTFYHFAMLDNFEAMKEPLLEFCKENGLKGTILLAHEGINSTISGSREGIDHLYRYLQADSRLEGISWKESYAAFQPFLKMKVRLKKEIVAMGVETLDVDQYRGEYISPNEWDRFINDPEVMVIDTRNIYEIAVGTFKGAINPQTKTFREFPRWVEEQLLPFQDKKIAMYCTGGIRCEKSTAYLKQRGFQHVYHLQGGILQYFEETKNRNEQWQGECFVFDDRAMVDPNLTPSNNLTCQKCAAMLSTDDLKRIQDDKIYCFRCRHQTEPENPFA